MIHWIWDVKDIVIWGRKNVPNVYEDTEDYAEAILSKYETDPAMLRDNLTGELRQQVIDIIIGEVGK